MEGSKLDELISTNANRFRLMSDSIKEAFEPILKAFAIFKNMVYIDHDTFETLLDIYQPTPIADIDNFSRNHPDKYLVYTNSVKAPQYAGQQFIVDKDVAVVIGKLDMAYRHKKYGDISKEPFNKNVPSLEIDDHTFKLQKNGDTYKLCRMLFGSKQYIKKTWQWKDIDKRVIDHAKDTKDVVNAFKLKIYRLNEKIEQKAGYREFILFRDKTVRVNPQYLFLFI